MEYASINMDQIDSHETLNLSNQLRLEEEAGGSSASKRRRYSKGVGIMKHHSQEPDANHRWDDIEDSRVDIDHHFMRTPPKPQQHFMTSEEFVPVFCASTSRKQHSPSPVPHPELKGSRGTVDGEPSLSDKICDAVWSRNRRKESAPFVHPLGSGSRRHSSVRRGTAPSVPPLMRQSIDLGPDAFGRSQSFKGSSSSASVRNRICFRRDPLSRRASGDVVETSRSYGALPSLKAKKRFGRDCSESGMDHNGHNNLGQSELNSLHSSATGSGQNLSISMAPHLLERKILSRGSVRSRDGAEGEVDSAIKREISMTLSIPSRENSVRSHTSVNSAGSYSAAAAPIVALASFCSRSQLGEGRILKPAQGRLVRYGSNPDVFPPRRAKLKGFEQETFYQSNNAKRASSKSLIAGGELTGHGSSANIASTISALGDGGICKKQKTHEEPKRNEKVAWAVHLSFSFLLILAITCIVASVRISSFYDKDSAVRKENENLLQSIQPQLNLHNATTPLPSTQTPQVQDNSNGNDNGIGNPDKSIASLQKSGLSLTRDPEDENREEDQQTSNNETTHKNLEIVKREEGGENGGSSRSNNHSSSSILINNDSTINSSPSIKSNSKPSRRRRRLEEDEQPPRTSNIIISVLNEEAHANSGNNDEAPHAGLTKTRHLESTIIRYLKNSSGQGMRERRNLVEGSRKL